MRTSPIFIIASYGVSAIYFVGSFRCIATMLGEEFPDYLYTLSQFIFFVLPPTLIALSLVALLAKGSEEKEDSNVRYIVVPEGSEKKESLIV